MGDHLDRLLCCDAANQRADVMQLNAAVSHYLLGVCAADQHRLGQRLLFFAIYKK